MTPTPVPPHALIQHLLRTLLHPSPSRAGRAGYRLELVAAVAHERRHPCQARADTRRHALAARRALGHERHVRSDT